MRLVTREKYKVADRARSSRCVGDKVLVLLVVIVVGSILETIVGSIHRRKLNAVDAWR